MKLTYWVSECLADSQAYNIREATKKAVLDELQKLDLILERHQKDVFANEENTTRYSLPRKIELEYSSGLDLLKQCLSEGGIYEGKH